MNSQSLIFPYNENTGDVFASTEFLTPVSVPYTDGNEVFKVDTMPLKPWVTIDILGLSTLEPLLEAGFIDYTDCIAPGLRIDTLVFQTKTGVITINVDEQIEGDEHVFKDSLESSVEDQTVQFNISDSVFGDSVGTSGITIRGRVQREMGIVCVAADVDPKLVKSLAVDFIGYEVSGFRTNLNR